VRAVSAPPRSKTCCLGYLSKSVEIDVGADAALRASGIYLIAQAEDRALDATLGLTTLESQLFQDLQ